MSEAGHPRWEERDVPGKTVRVLHIRDLVAVVCHTDGDWRGELWSQGNAGRFDSGGRIRSAAYPDEAAAKEDLERIMATESSRPQARPRSSWHSS